MIEPMRLSSGYWQVWLGPECFAQWPIMEPLRRKHIFQPEWNEARVMEWYREWLKAK